MLKIGLAGKPNAGKSTFFKAATLDEVETANYPFTTVGSNVGIARVRTKCPCLEKDKRCGNCREGKRYVPIQLIDVAGLVPEAHLGRGLGNEFLDELRRAEAIINVVDASGSTDTEGKPISVGEHDPIEDLDFIKKELDAWIKSIIEENFNRLKKSSNPEEKLIDSLTGLGLSKKNIKKIIRSIDKKIKNWEKNEIENFAKNIRKTKPITVVANKIDKAPERYIDKLTSRSAIPTSAKSELELRKGDQSGLLNYAPGDNSFDVNDKINEEQKKLLEEIENILQKYGGTGVQEAINTVVYDSLDMITVYPVDDESDWTDSSGEMLPDAFLLKKGSVPKDLAYEIHSDIGENYLYAIDAKSGRRIGERELKEGDVIKIKAT